MEDASAHPWLGFNHQVQSNISERLEQGFSPTSITDDLLADCFPNLSIRKSVVEDKKVLENG
jgi:hypothetical protein